MSQDTCRHGGDIDWSNYWLDCSPQVSKVGVSSADGPDFEKSPFELVKQDSILTHKYEWLLLFL